MNDCVITESLLVVKSVGIQIRTVYYSGSIQEKFISCGTLCDVVISESVKMVSNFIF